MFEFAGYRKSVPYWRCECACGRMLDVNGYHLRAGDSTSCRQCANLALRKYDTQSKYCPVCEKWLLLGDFADEPNSRSPSKKHGCCFVCDTASRHHLTKASYQEILERQNGLCAIQGCNRLATQIDHDHQCCSGSRSCGKCVRGILCIIHNLALGKFGDNPIELRAGADYIENFRKSVGNFGSDSEERRASNTQKIS